MLRVIQQLLVVIFHMPLKPKPLILVVMLKVIQLKLMVLLVTLVVLMVKQWSTSFVHGVTSQPATIVFGLYTSSDTMYVDNLSIKHLLVVLVLVL
jgi:hypothetical protein